MADDPIPLFDLRSAYEDQREEIDAALKRAVEGQHFVLGPEVAAFEHELAVLCGVRFAVGCGSGSDALMLALQALGIGPGDDVICPPFTFFATAGVIARLGARPAFADIEPSTFLMDPEQIRRTAEACPRLGALLPVDLFGRSVDTDAFSALSQELGVPLVEDAAQALGALDSGGRAAGARSDLACFSFYPTKNLGAFGDAGAIITNDGAKAERLISLRAHGVSPSTGDIHDEVGINARLDALQAAVLRAKLTRLEDWTKARGENATYYDDAFTAAGAAVSGEPFEEASLELRPPAPVEAGARHANHHYVVRVNAKRRDSLRAYLDEHGIGTAIYYPLGLHEQPCFASLGYTRGDFPETESAAAECLALPVHPALTRSQLERVVDRVVRGLQR